MLAVRVPAIAALIVTMVGCNARSNDDVAPLPISDTLCEAVAGLAPVDAELADAALGAFPKADRLAAEWRYRLFDVRQAAMRDPDVPSDESVAIWDATFAVQDFHPHPADWETYSDAIGAGATVIRDGAARLCGTTWTPPGYIAGLSHRHTESDG